LQMLGLGFALALVGLAVLGIVALTAEVLGVRLRSSLPLASVLRWLTSSVLVALSIHLAIPERQ
jgi:threonine/homoserine/homoserine lactone efflux protein